MQKFYRFVVFNNDLVCLSGNNTNCPKNKCKIKIWENIVQHLGVGHENTIFHISKLKENNSLDDHEFLSAFYKYKTVYYDFGYKEQGTCYISWDDIPTSYCLKLGSTELPGFQKIKIEQIK